MLILISAWSFANKHEVRLLISHAEDDLLAPLLVQHAAGAVAEILTDNLQRARGVVDTVLRLR